MGNEEACLYLCNAIAARDARVRNGLKLPEQVTLVGKAEIEALEKHFSNPDDVKSLNPDSTDISFPSDPDTFSIQIWTGEDETGHPRKRGDSRSH